VYDTEKLHRKSRQFKMTGLLDSQSESFVTRRGSGRYAQDPTTIHDGCDYVHRPSTVSAITSRSFRTAELTLAFDCGMRALDWIGEYLISVFRAHPHQFDLFTPAIVIVNSLWPNESVDRSRVVKQVSTFQELLNYTT
jgi:hypothetical protein